MGQKGLFLRGHQIFFSSQFPFFPVYFADFCPAGILRFRLNSFDEKRRKK